MSSMELYYRYHEWAVKEHDLTRMFFPSNQVNCSVTVINTCGVGPAWFSVSGLRSMSLTGNSIGIHGLMVSGTGIDRIEKHPCVVNDSLYLPFNKFSDNTIDASLNNFIRLSYYYPEFGYVTVELSYTGEGMSDMLFSGDIGRLSLTN